MPASTQHLPSTSNCFCSLLCMVVLVHAVALTKQPSAASFHTWHTPFRIKHTRESAADVLCCWCFCIGTTCATKYLNNID